eukprot:12178076-Prorocentrum_lima.AAC.1
MSKNSHSLGDLPHNLDMSMSWAEYWETCNMLHVSCVGSNPFGDCRGMLDKTNAMALVCRLAVVVENGR